MYYDTHRKELNTARIYPGDIVFGVILARWAFHLAAVVVVALMFATFIVLNGLLGLDGDTTLYCFLIGFPLLAGVLGYRYSKRCHAREAARAAAYEAARLEAARPVPIADVVPGMVSNPPAPWFDSDGRPLWIRQGDGWIPAYVAEAASTVIPPSAPILSARRQDRI